MATKTQDGPAAKPGKREVRREANTSKIIAASIQCLNKYGYGKTTLSVIAKTARASRGQVQHIFGMKRSDLLGRIAEEIFNRYVDEYEAARLAAKSPVELSDNMWDLIRDLYRRPETLALIEVWLATRNDRSFNRKLRDQLNSMDARVSEHWEEMFADAGLDVGKVSVIRYFQRSVMRGLAVERLLGGSEDIFDSILDLARKASADFLTNA